MESGDRRINPPRGPGLTSGLRIGRHGQDDASLAFLTSFFVASRSRSYPVIFPVEQFGIGVIVGRRAAAEKSEGGRAACFNAVGCSRMNADGISDLYRKLRVAQGHQPLSGCDVIELLADLVSMKRGSFAWEYAGLGKALRVVRVRGRVHQFPDFRTILGDVGLYRSVGLKAGDSRL
jgi:hypothetical protein